MTVPDFRSTADMIQGSTLDGVNACVQGVCTAPSGDGHMASYFSKSYVKSIPRMKPRTGSSNVNTKKSKVDKPAGAMIFQRENSCGPVAILGEE